MRKAFQKGIYMLLFSTLFMCCASENTSLHEYLKKEQISLIPQPSTFNYVDNEYVQINYKTNIYADSHSLAEANYLKQIIEESSIFNVQIVKEKTGNENMILLSVSPEMAGSSEGFSISTLNNTIKIKGKTPEGLMRGIQTLRQLFILPFHQKEKRKAWFLPSVTLSSSPKFEHRGLLLDVCRHFFDKDVVKKYIDLLAFYNMNVLHLHLTEDQGWRIESDKYPKLNEISSWRINQNGERYGGFYTKEELKEIVSYAQERHVTVIPEIELPGHSQAALAAYPEFACIGHNDTIEVINDWGVFKEIYCAGNDSTFIFLETILTEVMEIFPSKFIHIGGDEAPKYRWENCGRCQKRIKDENLHDEHELQNYFITRIEKFLNRNNRELIGWDEILEGGLSPNATVQSWRGMKGGIEAAKSNHKAIMSPTSHCYLDYGLDVIDMEKIYHFDPIPSELNLTEQQYIIGGECNMWTEHVPDEANLDSKVSPRMQALAEVLWSYPEERDYDDFYHRIQSHYPIMEAMGIAYGPEAIPADLQVEFQQNEVLISINKNIPNIDFISKWNGESVEMENGFKLLETGELEVKARKNNTFYGDAINQKFTHHKALTKPVDYNAEYNDWYTAGGEFALVDGRCGSTNFRDGNWQGFFGNDAELTIDLGEVQNIQSVSSNFYQYNNAWIFVPRNYKVSYSENKIEWLPYGVQQSKTAPETRGKLIETFSISNQVIARYLKIEVTSLGTIPDWHEAAGSKAWIFMDEIMVK